MPLAHRFQLAVVVFAHSCFGDLQYMRNSTFPVSGPAASTTTTASVPGVGYTRDQEVHPKVLVRCEEVLMKPPP